MSANDKIFISIAAIDEIFLRKTISSAIENAKNPESLVFGVCAQYQQYNKEDLSDFKNIRIVDLSSDYILGVGVSRTISSMLHSDEKYFLQIDAHMLFDKDWDEKLKNTYNLLRLNYGKVVISGYAPIWYTDNNGNIIKEQFDPELKSITLGYSSVAKQPIVSSKIKCEKIQIGNNVVYEQDAISYHFIFSEMEFIKNFLPDPFMIYNGDESTLSLRLFSRGYRIFMPKENILWHLHKQLDSFYSNQKEWWPPLYMGSQLARNDREAYINHAAYARVRDIFLGNILGYYGAEFFDDIIKYKEKLGIDFYQEEGRKI